MHGPGWFGRRRRGRIGRLPKPIAGGILPRISGFFPNPPPPPGAEPILLEAAEVQALVLVDLNGLSFEEAGQRMGVSRTTVWRLVKEARRKLAAAISDGRTILIEPPFSHSQKAQEG